MLESGCRTGVELANAWKSVQSDARGLVEFLGQELNGTLATEVLGVGEGSVTGSTRKKVVEQREMGVSAKQGIDTISRSAS